MLPPSARRLPAPPRIVEALASAAMLPVDAALARARTLFLECVESKESRALRYLFFAERQASGAPELARAVSRSAVLGAGTMGAGIAISLATGGVPVTLIDAKQDALDAGLARVQADDPGRRAQGSAQQRRCRGSARPCARIPDSCRREQRGPRGRGRVRESRRQARSLLPARPDLQARRRARDQYLDARRRCDRGRLRTAGGCRRHAFLQSGERHAPRRGGTWPQLIARGAVHGNRSREAHRQDRDSGRQCLRFRRQPHALRLRPREGADDAGRRAAGSDRPGHAGLRHGDGTECGRRPGGTRHRLPGPQGVGGPAGRPALLPRVGHAGRARPLRPEDRARLLPLRRAGQASARPIPRSWN